MCDDFSLMATESPLVALSSIESEALASCTSDKEAAAFEMKQHLFMGKRILSYYQLSGHGLPNLFSIRWKDTPARVVKVERSWQQRTAPSNLESAFWMACSYKSISKRLA